MKIYHWLTLLATLILMPFLMAAGCNDDDPDPVKPPVDTTSNQQIKTDIELWLTKADKTILLKRQNIGILFSSAASQAPVIDVDDTRKYQPIDGFGFALTGGSASLINRLQKEQRDALIRELFSADSGCIGLSYIRISIGASDLSAYTFSYNEIGNGQTDLNLSQFDLSIEDYDLIPVIKSALSHNPNLKILGSPWSAPKWMKTKYDFYGGSLKPEYYDVYARYFVKYLQEMEKRGVKLDAITIQNEPLNEYNNPSMFMSAADQATFIKNFLGPAFRAAGLTTKIIVYDHNCDHPEYPMSILADADAAQYVDGSAFHLYAGDISALSTVHNAYPGKNIYFTEQWVGGPGNFSSDLKWHTENLIIGATRNWSRNVLEWNLASDPSYLPHTINGCSKCEGALTIGNSVNRNVSYYIVAQASKFVPTGSVRIESNMIAQLPNVAFLTPAGKRVLIVLNKSDASQTFQIKADGKWAKYTLSGNSVGTFIW